jgi:hypothetical protein
MKRKKKELTEEKPLSQVINPAAAKKISFK